jgi:hypothetical protein
MISVILTACDRLDLLEKTLKSFLEFNTFPIDEYIVRDDSGLEDVWFKTRELLVSLNIPFLFFEKGQLGQARSIDEMISIVTTPYVFHLEDDWEFDRGGFIEDCLEVIDSKTAQVRVRHRDDGSVALTVPYSDLADKCTNHLFSFNPHLRASEIRGFEGKNETILGELVKKNNLKTLWLKEGACRHIGANKPTNRAGTSYFSGVKKA